MRCPFSSILNRLPGWTQASQVAALGANAFIVHALDWWGAGAGNPFGH